MPMQIMQLSILLVCVLTKQISYRAHSSPQTPPPISTCTHTHTHMQFSQSTINKVTCAGLPAVKHDEALHHTRINMLSHPPPRCPWTGRNCNSEPKTHRHTL